MLLLVFALDYSIKLLTLENGTMATSSSSTHTAPPISFALFWLCAISEQHPTHTLGALSSSARGEDF